MRVLWNIGRNISVLKKPVSILSKIKNNKHHNYTTKCSFRHADITKHNLDCSMLVECIFKAKAVFNKRFHCFHDKWSGYDMRWLCHYDINEPNNKCMGLHHMFTECQCHKVQTNDKTKPWNTFIIFHKLTINEIKLHSHNDAHGMLCPIVECRE